jgi:hypothetical protein
MPEPTTSKRRGRGKSKLRGSVLTRSAKALRAAQVPIKRVEVDSLTGRFNFIVGQPEEGEHSADDLDNWIATRARDARPA